MAFKKIACLLEGVEGDAPALAAAFAVARSTQGHVAATHVRIDPRDAVPMLGEGVSGTLVQEVLATAEKENERREAAAKKTFEEGRTAAGAAIAEKGPATGLTCHLKTVSGRVEDVAARVARASDLTVVSRLGPTRDTEEVLMIESVLMAGGRPLLVVPRNPVETLGRHVVILWNGSENAARAVAFSMDVITHADQVTVLTAKTSRTDPAVAADLVDLLSWHGLVARAETVTVASGSVGAALLQAAGLLGADLVVMGGYGTSRLRELIMGGVTRHVLDSATCPVLMAH